MDFNRILNVGPFRGKLQLLLMAIFLPAIGVIIVSGLNQRRNEIFRAQDRALLLTQSLEAQIEHITATNKTLLGIVAQLPEVQRLDAPACNQTFRKLNQRFPFFSNIFAATPDGNMFAASVPFEAGKINLSDCKHIKDAIKTRNFSTGEYSISRVNQMASLSYTSPVLDANDKLIAIVGGGFDLHEFSRFIAAINLPEGSVVSLLDHKGVRLDRWPQHEKAAIGQPVLPGFLWQVSGEREEGYFEGIGQDGTSRIYAFKQLRLRKDSPPYGYISVGLPKDKVLSDANWKMLRDLSLLGLAGLLNLAFLWILGDRLFIRPIDRLVTAVQRFGRGELTSRTGLPHTSDELGRLAQSFDDMAGLLQKRNLERQETELALKQAHDELEQRVTERTAELNQTVGKLHQEIESHLVDIAERKRAEAALRRANETLRATLDAAPVAILDLDMEGRVRSLWNPAAEKMLGWRRDEVLGHYLPTVPEESTEEFSRFRAWVHSGKPILGKDVVRRCKDGSMIEYSIYAAPQYDDHRQVIGNIAILVDIAERKRAEEELQAAAHKWRTTFNAITDAVSLMDVEGTVLQCNQAMADLVQKPFAEIQGRLCYEVVHGTSWPISDCPLARMRETRQREELLLPMGDRWFKMAVDPILDEAGELTGAVHIVSDVTKVTKTERSLYRRTQDLTIMNTIGSIVSRSLDLHTVLDDSLRMIQQYMFNDSSWAIIFLRDEATGELQEAGHRGVPENHPCLERPLQNGNCPCRRAAQDGEIIVSRQGCADCAAGTTAPGEGALQNISLPLRVRDRLLGVMHLSF